MSGTSVYVKRKRKNNSKKNSFQVNAMSDKNEKDDGRPTEKITIRLSVGQLRDIDSMCKKHGITRSDFIRSVLEKPIAAVKKVETRSEYMKYCYLIAICRKILGELNSISRYLKKNALKLNEPRKDFIDNMKLITNYLVAIYSFIKGCEKGG